MWNNNSMPERSEHAARPPRAKTIVSLLVEEREYAVSDWNNTGCKIHSSDFGPPGTELNVILVLDSDNCSYRIATTATVRWQSGNFTGVQFSELPEDATTLTAFKLRQALGLIGKETNKQETIESFVSSEDKKAAQILDSIKNRRNSIIEFIQANTKKPLGYFAYGTSLILLLSGLRLLHDRSQYIVITGKVDGQELAINSNFKGSIVNLKVQPGDIVEKGSPLLVALDEVELRENQAELEDLMELVEQYNQRYSLAPSTASYNELISLKAQLKHAENSVKRFEFLFRQGAVAKELLEEKMDREISLRYQILAKEDSRVLYEDLKDRYQQKALAASRPFNSNNVLGNTSESSIVNRYQNGLRTIISPATALVKSLPQPVGTPLRVGTTIAILSNVDKPTVKAYVTPQQASQIVVNTPVEILVESSGTKLSGAVKNIELSGGYGYRFTLDQFTENFIEDTYKLGDTPAEIVINVDSSQEFDLGKSHGLRVKVKIKKAT